MSAEKIMGISEAAAPAMIEMAARMYTASGLDRRTPPVMNLIISNVPGPPFPLYTAGAEVTAMYPMGPLLFGTGINVTVFSYMESIDFGFMVCREAVPNPWLVAEGIPLALEELQTAAAVR
ncbi:MAG: WS/DGAT domain-containing protein [Acidimicrobiia bacterium]|nr:WS/DGAT domain-containing protein [Acidimicrobiia bacterium]